MQVYFWLAYKTDPSVVLGYMKYGAHGRVVKALDLRSRGLVFGSRATLVMCKSLGAALNPHCLCRPSRNGYLVERKLVLCEWLQLQKLAMHSSQWDETVQEWDPIPGDNWRKVRWAYGDIWTLNTQHTIIMYQVTACFDMNIWDLPMSAIYIKLKNAIGNNKTVRYL